MSSLNFTECLVYLITPKDDINFYKEERSKHLFYKIVTHALYILVQKISILFGISVYFAESEALGVHNCFPHHWHGAILMCFCKILLHNNNNNVNFTSLHTSLS